MTCSVQLMHHRDILEPLFPDFCSKFAAEPHSLRTGGRWFDPWLGQYSLYGLMIVIAKGFIPFFPLSIVWTMVM